MGNAMLHHQSLDNVNEMIITYGVMCECIIKKLKQNNLKHEDMKMQSKY